MKSENYKKRRNKFKIKNTIQNFKTVWCFPFFHQKEIPPSPQLIPNNRTMHGACPHEEDVKVQR